MASVRLDPTGNELDPHESVSIWTMQNEVGSETGDTQTLTFLSNIHTTNLSSLPEMLRHVVFMSSCGSHSVDCLS